MRKGVGPALAALLVALLVVALAGCVGIPSSGGVSEGGVIDDQASPEFVVLPSDPVPGSPQEQILSDFMQALSSPQGGYAVAKKYLTSEFATVWHPDASAIIRTGPFAAEVTGADTITYSFTSRASVNDRGQFLEGDLSSQSLEFSFAKEGGEWRISHAPDGVVLSQSAFNIAFREQALYFFDPSFTYLVPDVRWFPSRQTSSTRVVQALLEGPSAWLQQAVTTAFPEATKFGQLTTEAGTTVVDLSTEALNSTPTDGDRMRQQLVATLDTPNVKLTVNGLDFDTPDAAGARAIVNPTVDSAVLIGSGTEFGFAGAERIAPISGLSDQVVAGGAVAADLASDKRAVAFLGSDGGVYAALAGESEPVLLSSGPGMIAPAIDPFRFVWSAQAGSAATLTAWDLDGVQQPISSGLPPDSSIVSLDVSRDGTRLLLLLATPVGARLVVTGIVRQDNVPVALGVPLELAIGAGTPVDATWVGNRAVATISADDEGAFVTAFTIGGPSLPLGRVQDARTIVGGNGGTDGLRVLAADGSIWRPRGSEGWVATEITATFLATKQ